MIYGRDSQVFLCFETPAELKSAECRGDAQAITDQIRVSLIGCRRCRDKGDEKGRLARHQWIRKARAIRAQRLAAAERLLNPEPAYWPSQEQAEALWYLRNQGDPAVRCAFLRKIRRGL